MIKQMLKMIPSSAFKALPEKLEEIIDLKLKEVGVEVLDGERAAVLLIEGNCGYMINILKLSKNLDITIVEQYTLKDFIDNVIKYLKDGNIG